MRKKKIERTNKAEMKKKKKREREKKKGLVKKEWPFNGQITRTRRKTIGCPSHYPSVDVRGPVSWL
jgi:hypothetical protein